jgi:hypothetical protein
MGKEKEGSLKMGGSFYIFYRPVVAEGEANLDL